MSEETDAAATDPSAPVEPPLDSTEVAAIEGEVVEIEPVPRIQRDSLSIALVAGLAALLLICVIFIFIANGHRPAGL